MDRLEEAAVQHGEVDRASGMVEKIIHLRMLVDRFQRVSVPAPDERNRDTLPSDHDRTFA